MRGCGCVVTASPAGTPRSPSRLWVVPARRPFSPVSSTQPGRAPPEYRLVAVGICGASLQPRLDHHDLASLGRVLRPAKLDLGRSSISQRALNRSARSLPLEAAVSEFHYPGEAAIV